MRFYVTSDLHFGLRSGGDKATIELAQHVTQNPLDALILVGDLGHDLQSTGELLALFADFEGLKLAVPGNHDVWLDPAFEGDSWALHEEALPEVFEAHGFHPLHLLPLQVGDTAFVGSMGWYDYSFRDEEIGIPLSAYEAKTLPGERRPLWNDAVKANFNKADVPLTRLLDERLQAQLKQTLGARHVVAAVHHVVTKALLVHPRERVPHMWRFANAFLGANRYGQTLQADPRVKTAFCGHIHMERRARLGGCQCFCVGSDYRRKQLLVATPTGVESDRWFGAAPKPRRGR